MCWKSGEWSVTGSECLGMCVPEVRYGGEERNTATLYQSYTEIQVTTDLVGSHLLVLSDYTWFNTSSPLHLQDNLVSARETSEIAF